VKLIVAHQILIASGIALGVLFGVRALYVFAVGRGAVDLGMGIASLVIAVVLALYLRKVRAGWLADRHHHGS
jgi:hypothetical protein